MDFGAGLYVLTQPVNCKPPYVLSTVQSTTGPRTGTAREAAFDVQIMCVGPVDRPLVGYTPKSASLYLKPSESIFLDPSTGLDGYIKNIKIKGHGPTLIWNPRLSAPLRVDIM